MKQFKTQREMCIKNLKQQKAESRGSLFKGKLNKAKSSCVYVAMVWHGETKVSSLPRILWLGVSKTKSISLFNDTYAHVFCLLVCSMQMKMIIYRAACAWGDQQRPLLYPNVHSMLHDFCKSASWTKTSSALSFS